MSFACYFRSEQIANVKNDQPTTTTTPSRVRFTLSGKKQNMEKKNHTLHFVLHFFFSFFRGVIFICLDRRKAKWSNKMNNVPFVERALP